MTAGTLTLTDFLLARIAEDEAVAQAVAAENVGGAKVPLHLGDNAWEDEWPFAERFDPARVLAECEAKQQIVAEHPLTTNVVPVTSGPTPGYACDRCARLDQIHEDSIVEDQGACNTLRALAGVYADHPDYRQEWRP